MLKHAEKEERVRKGGDIFSLYFSLNGGQSDTPVNLLTAVELYGCVSACVCVCIYVYIYIYK